MPGGVAIFDYNRDGHQDIFFTNGANIETLKKDSPKYRNRLFRNDGNGVFTDVTEAAGLAGAGYDMGAAVGDFDNDGWPDLFVAGVHHNTLYPQQWKSARSPTAITEPGWTIPLIRNSGPLWAVAASLGRRQQRWAARPLCGELSAMEV